ncbi:hypothetical protein DFS33DRAFT_1317713 [Desarmillaria ectypa]|nr:hypothetical protein DFS33DRAFT_1317713 [Desarmillaria ectypa]
MADDFADILGSDSLPVRREFSPSAWSVTSLLKYAGWTLGAVVTYVVLVLGWNSFSKAREKSYKLSMRRRHGIPDNDHRPFNVAYAAVQRSRQAKERPTPAQRSQETANTQTAHEARPVQAEQVIRNRGEGRSALQSQAASPSNFPGQYVSSATEQLYPSLPASEAVPPPPTASTPPNRVVFADGYNTSALHIGVPSFAERPVRKTNGILKPTNTHRKRGLEEEPIIVDNSKKSRVEGDEFIDGDEEAGWQNSPSGSTRGNKRSFGDEDNNEEATVSKRAREKRPRKVSRDHEAVASDEDMEVDEDEIVEVRATPRGRKRDRVEAGPSFDGEEDREPAEVEAKPRGRKRRNKRRSDVGVKARGTKRERDIDDEEVLDDAEESFAQVSRKKRGKRAQAVQEDEYEDDRYADISIDVSPDRVKGREIGEEWESNGVRYKVGPNGQRLRQALVKKAGQRYIMPKDSQHPDREANIEVCVEKWLTEEEFREAKQQRLLAWQDSTPSKSSEPSTPSSEVPPSPSSGKHLLWDATGSPKTDSLRDPFGKPSTQQSQGAIRQSVATTIGLQPTFRRRIAGNFTPTSPSPTPPSPGYGLADSTNGSPRRAQKGYSKWEKQDLEAKAMMKMREANQKKREEREVLDRLEKEKKEKSKASLTPQPTIPVISVTKPAEESAAPKNAFNLGGPASGSSNKPAFSLASAAPLGSASQPSLSSAPPSGSTSSPSPMPVPPLNSTSAPNTTPLGGASKPVTTGNPFFKQPPALSNNKAAFSFPPATSSPLATNSPTKAHEKPKAPGLGFPSAINPTPTPPSASTPATSATPAQPATKFSFNQNVSAPASAPTNSLLARMGPQQQQQQQSPPSPATQPVQKPQTTFSFSTPPAAQSSTPSFFGKPAESTSKPAPTAAPAPAKFNFSAAAKPNATPSSLSSALGSTSQTSDGKPAEPSSNFGTFSFAKPPTMADSGSRVPSSNPFGAATTGKFNFGTKEASPIPAPTLAAGGFGAQGQSTLGTPKESTPAPSTAPAAISAFGADKPAFGAFKESTAAPAPTSTPAFSGFGAPGNSPFGTPKESTPTPAAPSSTPAASTFTFGALGKSAFGTPKESTPASTTPAAPSFGAFGTTGQSAFGAPKESAPMSTTTTPATSAFGGFGGADKSKPFGGFGQDSGNSMFGASPSSAFGKSGVFGAAEKEKEASGSDSNANGTANTPSAPTFGSSAFSSPFGKAAQSGGPGTPSSAFGTSGAFGAAVAKGTEASGPDSSSAQANGPTTTFGSTSSPSPFGKPAQSGSGDAPKPVFSFGASTGTTPAPSAGAFSFASKPAVFGGGSGSTTPVFGATAEKK